MSNAARKARKSAGIPFSKPPKTPTRAYESTRDAQKRRAAEARSTVGLTGVAASLAKSLAQSVRRFRGGNR